MDLGELAWRVSGSYESKFEDIKYLKAQYLRVLFVREKIDKDKRLVFDGHLEFIELLNI